MPFVFEQPNLDNELESHLYFDPGDGRLITVFTNEERTPDPARTPTDPGACTTSPSRCRTPPSSQAVERLDERGIKHSGVKDRGFMDSIYFEDPLGLLIELASYRFEPPSGYTHADVLLEAHKLRVARGDTTSPRSISPTRSNCSSRDHGRGCPTTARRRIRTENLRTETQEDRMAEITIHILKPSVNNLTVRMFVRAAGLDFEEIDLYGPDGTPEFLREEPVPADADDRGGGAAAGGDLGELRDHAVPLQQARPGGLLSRPIRRARAMVDSAMFYLIGTFYPVVTRATYPALGLPAVRGRSRHLQR